MKQGLFYDVPMADYHADKSAVSRSMLMDMRKSPLHCYANHFDPSRPVKEEKNEAYTLGSMFHCAVLEPHLFDKQYKVAPKFDRRTKVGKEGWEEFCGSLLAGQEAVTQDQYATAKAMAESIMSNTLARSIFDGGTPEVSAYGIVNGVGCRIRPDYVAPGRVMADLKSAVDASQEAFARSVIRYGYDVQNAFYRDVWKAACEDVLTEFFFVVCEKTYPFASAVYVLTDEDIEYARQEYVYQLERFAFCRANNQWPGYGDTAQVLQLPQWRKSEETEVEFA